MFDSTVTEPSYSESRDSPGSRSESAHLEDAFNPHVPTDSNMTGVSPNGESPTRMQELHTDSEDTTNDTGMLAFLPHRSLPIHINAL